MSYFYGKTAAALYARECNYANIIDNNGSVVENKDGTVSVYTNTGSPFALNKYCCEVIKVGYTFNLDTQRCMWSTTVPTIASQSIQTTTPCSLDSFKLTLNPNGNNGSLFYVGDSSETCSLNIEFDYLIKISCESLTSILNGGNVGKPMISTVQTTQLISNAQTVECEALAKQIARLKETIAATNYSITCTQDIPYVYTPPTQAALTPFTRTGFGLYEFDLSDYVTETLCLTDAGLTEWSKILGSRYNSFLAGDPNSYNCVDFNKLKEKNISNLNNDRPELSFTCTTPFGTKTKLINDLNKLQTQYDYCIKESSVTTTQLAQQETIITTSENMCGTPIDTIENLDISVTLDYVDSNQALVTVATYPLLASIGTGNLYTYLSENEESGFLVCGEPNSSEIANGITGCTPLYLGSTDNVFSCSGLITNILDGLFIESGLDRATFDATFNKKALGSKWLRYNVVVSDESVLAQIANKNIKITIKVNSSCGDFCILLDNIQLNKVCTLVSENNMFISSSPGFELNRVIDNKKSWVANTTPENRPFSITNVLSTNGIRQTNYDVNDERLVINTKEIDLDIDIASAIETDVWCYISDNPCLLTATTTSDCCNSDCSVDYSSLMTQPLSDVKTVEDFEYYLSSELIDVKSRKVLSGYPTLRALYDRYSNSADYCPTTSSSFGYEQMDQFAHLIDNYWVDIVEQVIPATTIWGSVKIYGNTIFDQQKFQYKKSSLFTCLDTLNTAEQSVGNLDWLNTCIGSTIDKFYLTGCTVTVPCNINTSFGYLYNWYAATDVLNIANPDGGNGQTNTWHLPSSTEFATLTTYLGGDAIAGGKLKTTGTVEGLDGCWYAPNSGATNLYSFDSMPGGRRHYTTGVFANLGNYANYWTDTINFAPNAFFVTLFLNQEYTVTTSADYNWGIAVRLVRDASVSEQLLTDGTNSIDNPTLLDPYIGNDGKVYKTTKIGTQIWLSQDLLETKFNDLSNITEIINDVDWNGLTTAARATYSPVSICQTQNCN